MSGPDNNLVSRVRAVATAYGLPTLEVRRTVKLGGDEFVEGTIGKVEIQFLRDRGQEEIWFPAPPWTTARRYVLEDVVVGLGWVDSPEEADKLALTIPGGATVESSLTFLAQRWSEFTVAIASENEVCWRKIETAGKARTDRLWNRLGGR